MKAGSMEALIGANQNMKLASTPLRVYKEAERRGDTATMERAMNYVQEFEQKAADYSQKAQEETAKEIKEERREQEIKRQKAIEKRREDANAFEEKLQEKAASDTNTIDSVEISEDGKTNLEQQNHSGEPITIVSNPDVKMYDSEGKGISTKQGSVSVDARIGNS